MTTPNAAPVCICGRIRIGMEVTDLRNWDPDCAEHGIESDWWRSADQVEKRAKQNDRLRELQRLARLAKTDHAAAQAGLAALDGRGE